MLSINIPPKGKMLVAVSGGIDSVVLLDILAKKNVLDLCIAHFNHKIRGKDADDDESFVKNLAKEYGIPFYSGYPSKKIMSEEAGREERYQFLYSIQKQVGAPYIALAHHKDDQIETLLLQLLRGTHSFSPMQELSKEKWRPLLAYTKEELIAYAKEQHLQWREDVTNTENTYTRNHIRNIILPELEKIQPNFKELFFSFCMDTYQQSLSIKKEAQQFLQSHRLLARKEFLSQSDYLQSALLKEKRGELYKEHIAEVKQMIALGIGGKQKHGVSLKSGNIVFDGTPTPPLLILASASPQRRELLSNAGFYFSVIPSDFEEIHDPKMSIEENILRFSKEKAKKVFSKNTKNIVIGCDTVVIHPTFGLFEKPKDREDAKHMILAYSEQSVQVLSGLTVIFPTQTSPHIVCKPVYSTVYFANIGDNDAETLLSKNEWQGRSGAISIEGYSMRYTKGIEGCFFNIIGLPIQELQNIFTEQGFSSL